MSQDSEPHVRFEYDPEFTGGEYEGTGRFALVPYARVQEAGAEAAFTEATGLDAMHIVHFTVDELYDAEGETVEPDAPSLGV